MSPTLTATLKTLRDGPKTMGGLLTYIESQAANMRFLASTGHAKAAQIGHGMTQYSITDKGLEALTC